MRMTAGRRPRAGRSAPPAHAQHLADAGRVYSGLNRIIDTVRQPLTVLDERLHIIFANRAFYRVFAVTPEETIGQHLAAAGGHRLDVSALHGFLDLIQAESHAVEDYEIEIELPTLGRRVLLLNAQKIGGAPKPAREILVTVDDVTERKRAKIALKSANWQSERAKLGKSRFLSAASHGLRQPLQALSLTRGILAKKINDEEGLKLVARLNKTADAMSSMLNSLLDIDQLEAGMVRAEKINFPVDDVLEQLRIEFANDALLHGLLWRVVPCRLIIYSDPVLLQQIIRNLLSNAVRYTDRGKILLGCRRRGDKLRIEVWDTGIGIPEEQFQTIFGEFHRLDNATGERGLGLGLAIVQRLADLGEFAAA
jgi:two-component system CheB/CheR fusion protein